MGSLILGCSSSTTLKTTDLPYNSKPVFITNNQHVIISRAWISRVSSQRSGNPDRDADERPRANRLAPRPSTCYGGGDCHRVFDENELWRGIITFPRICPDCVTRGNVSPPLVSSLTYMTGESNTNRNKKQSIIRASNTHVIHHIILLHDFSNYCRHDGHMPSPGKWSL